MGMEQGSVCKKIWINESHGRIRGFSLYDIDICQNKSILKKATYVENKRRRFYGEAEKMQTRLWDAPKQQFRPDGTLGRCRKNRNGGG
jgi:hypothetical protein